MFWQKNIIQSKMKILCLSMEVTPQLFGGLGTHVVGLNQELCKQGHEVDIVVYVAEKYKNVKVWEIPNCKGIKIIPVYLPIYSKVYWIDQLYSNTFVMAKLLNSEKFDYDIIHCHSWIFFTVAMELRRRYHVPIVTTLHRLEAFRGELYENAINHHFIMELDKLVCNKSDAIICVSKDMENQVYSISGRKEAVAVLPNGINVNDFEIQLDSRYYEPTRILFVGRLEPEKGLLILLKALEYLHQQNIAISLTVVGEGTQTDILEKGDFFYPLNYLHKLDSKQISKIYAKHDIVVVPSLTEPFGIVAIEALAAGLPVIASRVGGLADIISDSQLGYLFEKGDYHALAQLLLNMILHAHYKENALNRRKYVEKNYSWEKIAHNTTNIFEQILSIN